ncbi:MAG: DUF3883 domain-containing protein [Candidatus Riflebacteria bacterium]|nr:DUF3883 domain-containing protein [Candidatus Riflebacteria bacterium]
MLKLQNLQPRALVRGLAPSQNVEIVAVTPVGEAITVVYRLENGQLADRLLFPSDEDSLDLVTEGRPWSFDGDGHAFKLGAESWRIHLAHLFDPLMAVHTSNIEPLPHQIAAVYQTMLHRQPLRFLLADDPGAGKTIMAGLLIKELMIRGDVKRCMVVAPGSLSQQWQDEMDEKFGLRFTIFSRELSQNAAGGNPFDDPACNLMICRLDQLSRNEDLHGKLENSDWDLIIVDESHKLSASIFGTEIKETKRYQLGKLLGRITRHFLLMTATPHNGKEEDFQLFLALIDSDRFYGHFRDGARKVDVGDIMHRMIKEELLRFDGTPLFPERRSYTVNYPLSETEAALYEAVTAYVRTEMNKAKELDGKRKGTVGFALTILQRRLASSPEAIFRSLERRRKKLEGILEEEKLLIRGRNARLQAVEQSHLYDEDALDDLDDAPSEELENLEDELVGETTAAQNIPDLEAEIVILRVLEAQARQLRLSRLDHKWQELSRLLQETPEMHDQSGSRRKLIIFTEHRDTLNYLHERITGLMGSTDAVVIIHGGTRREERKKSQERFTQEKDVLILLATDAAGEGVNLQRAHLMVNYDLPWNPNRLEQRFGRIHRIGQTEVCHLWNLVAKETREGAVYQRLLDKLEIERKALGGRVFDVLGQVFDNRALKELLLDAILYGDDPVVKARLHERVETLMDTEHIKSIIESSALATETMDATRVFAIREEMEKAEARKLQPHFIRAFFIEAFTRLGGKLFQREPDRYEISFVPANIRERDRLIGNGQPILRKYERVCFEKDRVTVSGKPLAAFLCPGHPLMDSVVDLVLEGARAQLKRGTVLVDPQDDGEQLKVLFLIDHAIRDAGQSNSEQQRHISRRLQFVLLDRDGTAHPAGYAPYLDYRPASPDEVKIALQLFDANQWNRDLEAQALAFAIKNMVPEHLGEVKERRERLVDRTIQAVHERLVHEIAFWSTRAVKLREEVTAGKQPRMQPENAERRALELQERLKTRMTELEAQRHVISTPPILVGGACIIPIGLLRKMRGEVSQQSTDPEARSKIEKLAMKAVADRERALGHEPIDVSAQKLGWDITSRVGNGDLRLIEVKGRIKGSTTVTVTKNEILVGLNQPEKFILAIVFIDGEQVDGPHYVLKPFNQQPDFSAVSVNYDLADLLAQAQKPM